VLVAAVIVLGFVNGVPALFPPLSHPGKEVARRLVLFSAALILSQRWLWEEHLDRARFYLIVGLGLVGFYVVWAAVGALVLHESFWDRLEKASEPSDRPSFTEQAAARHGRWVVLAGLLALFGGISVYNYGQATALRKTEYLVSETTGEAVLRVNGNDAVLAKFRGHRLTGELRVVNLP